jgi:hypothetical protein
MAQRTVPCGISLGVCRLRVTTLDPTTGCVSSGADNSYVLEDLISVEVAPNIETGTDTILINGCGCKIAAYKAPDILKRYDLTLTTPIKSAALESMLTDGGVLFDDSTAPVPVGYSFPSEIDCTTGQTPVAVEFWTKNWDGDAQASELPWIHWVFPYMLWAPGPQTVNNDLSQPDFIGFTRTNECWGDGPYGDGPEATFGASSFSLATGGWFYTPTDPPAASCDFDTVTPAS